MTRGLGPPLISRDLRAILADMSRQGLAKRAATYADLLEVPDHMVAEILDGELYASPRPAVLHALASSALGVEIGGPFHQGRGGPGGWWILDEPELHLQRDVLVPDLAGWRRSKMPTPPAAAAIELAPDWACEILSPSTEAIDRVPKLRIYAREGVGHVWFVNPHTRTLEVLRLERGAWVVVATHDGDVTVNVEPFDAVPLEMYRLWGHDAPEL
jgi:Uma2 family endonuclease